MAAHTQLSMENRTDSAFFGRDVLIFVGLLLALLVLNGCGSKSSRETAPPQQGTSEWVESPTDNPMNNPINNPVNNPIATHSESTAITPVPLPEIKAKTLPSPSTSSTVSIPTPGPVKIPPVDFQKVAQDTKLLVAPPGYKYFQLKERRVLVPIAPIEVTNAITHETPDLKIDYKIKIEAPAIQIPEPMELSEQDALEIIRKLESAYLAGAPFDIALIREWVDAVRALDQKTDESIYVDWSAQAITLKNESVTLVNLLNTLLKRTGEINTPFFDSTGNKVSERKILFGGPATDDLKKVKFVDHEGLPCTDAICTLTAVYNVSVPETSPIGAPHSVLTPEDSEDAAYATVFLALRFQYLMNFRVPAEMLKNFIGNGSHSKLVELQSKYKIPLPNVPTGVVEALWILPPSFQGMPTIFDFSSALPHTMKNQSGEERGLDKDYGAIYRSVHSHYHNDLSVAGAPIGGIVFNHETGAERAKGLVVRYLKDRKEIVRALNSQELKVYEPSLALKLRYRSLTSAIHELSHAWEESMGGDPTISKRPEWMALGKWKLHRQQVTTMIPQHTLLYPSAKHTGWSLTSNFQPGPDSLFVSGYAMTSTLEDFAESVTAAALIWNKMPAPLKPKMEFLKENVFLGKIAKQPFNWKPPTVYESALKHRRATEIWTERMKLPKTVPKFDFESPGSIEFQYAY